MGRRHFGYLIMLSIFSHTFQASSYQICYSSIIRRSLGTSISSLRQTTTDSCAHDKHKAHMFLALRHAQYAQRNKEVPVGAVIVGKSCTRCISLKMFDILIMSRSNRNSNCRIKKSSRKKQRCNYACRD